MSTTRSQNGRQASRSITRIGCGAVVAALCVAGLPAIADEPPFSSTADTVFDIIKTTDDTQFLCLDYVGRTTRQMWDKRIDNESDLNVFLFQAYFEEGPTIDIILNPEFETVEDARAEALRYTRGLGQLPMIFRQGIKQFGIHMGDESFHAGTGKIFMYQDKTTLRISQKHLEESLMHESVHASLDATYRNSPEWRQAQQQDDAFVTRYAQGSPDREDLAETALFAYGLLKYPGRIPPVDSDVIQNRVPARIAVIADILATDPNAEPAPKPPDSCQ